MKIHKELNQGRDGACCTVQKVSEKAHGQRRHPGHYLSNLEDGLSDIDCESTDQLVTVHEVIEALSWLQNEDHDYQTVVIDTVDWLEKLIEKQVCDDGNVKALNDIGFGKGQQRCVPIMKFILEQLEVLRSQKNMMIVLLSHSRIDRFEDPEADSYDRYVPALGKTLSPIIREWCDEVLFADFKVFTKTTGRGIWPQEISCNGRYRTLRPYFSHSYSFGKESVRVAIRNSSDLEGLRRWHCYFLQEQQAFKRRA